MSRKLARICIAKRHGNKTQITFLHVVFLKKIDGFIVSLLGVIILAALFPSIGTSTEPIDLKKISEYGITIIFFFYGVKLSPKKISEGIANWKMHIVIQLATFILFPLLIILIKPLFSDVHIWLSIFFVAALPSTVSSSVVMVSLAKGNVPGAIFNATISSFGGIFISPMLLSFFIIHSNIGFNSSEIVLKLVFQILVPMIAGILLHAKLKIFAEKQSKKLKILDQIIVLLIVYTSFCASFKSGIFQTIALSTIIYIFIGMGILFAIVFFILRKLSYALNFSYADTITTIFCGSKKSLIHGVVLSKVLFSASILSGFILVPIMMYHSLQLIIIGFLIPKINRVIIVKK